MVPAMLIGQVPHELTPEGREDPKDHSRAKARVRQFNIDRQRPTQPPLPVAGLPLHSNEVLLAYKAKVRPALILGSRLPDLSAVLGPGTPKSHRHSPLTIAPYYGVDQDGSRTGYTPDFVKRVRRAEFPQYMFDQLPEIKGMKPTQASVLRFDHMQPVGRNAATCKPTKWRLSDEALQFLSSWTAWVFEGEPPKDCILSWLRKDLGELD